MIQTKFKIKIDLWDVQNRFSLVMAIIDYRGRPTVADSPKI